MTEYEGKTICDNGNLIKDNINTNTLNLQIIIYA